LTSIPGKGAAVWNWYQKGKRIWSKKNDGGWKLSFPRCCRSGVWGLWTVWFGQTDVHRLYGMIMLY